MALNSKNLSFVYSFDDEIGKIANKMLKLHMLKEIDEEKTAELIEVVRDMSIQDIAEEDIFHLEKFVGNLTHYTCLYIHGVAIFSNGRKNLFDMVDNVDIANELPQNYISDATNILIQALNDYYLPVKEFLLDSKLRADHLTHLVKFIACECTAELDDIENEDLFLSIFSDKAYNFTKFMATYIAILKGTTIKVREDMPKNPDEEIFEWLLRRYE